MRNERAHVGGEVMFEKARNPLPVEMVPFQILHFFSTAATASFDMAYGFAHCIKDAEKLKRIVYFLFFAG